MKPRSRIRAGSKTLRPSKTTGVLISFFIRSKSGRRNSFHSVTTKSASAPSSAS